MLAPAKGLAAALAGSLAIGAQVATVPNAAARSLAPLSVSGNLLLAGGQPIQLRGVNRSGTEYGCVQWGGVFDGPSDDASVAAMSAWHANAVRVPLNEDCWLGINGAPVGGLTAVAYQQAIKDFTERLHAHGLYAILDLHWSAPGAFQATNQEGMADADHSPTMWTSVAHAFGRDPATIFDLFNEPTGITWPCWRDGCLYDEAAASDGRGQWHTAGMQQLVAAVRKAGARNVILAGGLSFANDVSGWGPYAPVDPAHQLAASFHVYNFNTCSTVDCWNRQVAPVAARVPVVMGEIGQSSCAADFINSVMDWADPRRISYLAWVWDAWPGCQNVLVSDYAGTPTAGYGQGYQAHLQLRADPEASARASGPVAPVASRAPGLLPWLPWPVGALVLAGLALAWLGTMRRRFRVR